MNDDDNMDQLDFQDHPYEDTKGSVASSAPAEHTVEFSDFPPDATEGDEDGNGGTASGGQESKPPPSIFTLAYYQQFFDIDTFDVGNRILSSMMPNPKRNYLEHVIRPKPDLYGPFWICATLTFFIGITGNVANFFATSGLNFMWKYDFHKVSLAATVIFSYWLIIPIIIWGILRWRGSLAGYTLTELICVYGYSLAIFIPCSILWLIQVTWLQLLFAVVCSLLSGVTLLITLYPAVKNDSKQVMVGFLVIVIILHSLLATGFVLYFFRYSAIATRPSVPTQISPSNNSSLKYEPAPPIPKITRPEAPHEMISPSLLEKQQGQAKKIKQSKPARDTSSANADGGGEAGNPIEQLTESDTPKKTQHPSDTGHQGTKTVQKTQSADNDKQQGSRPENKSHDSDFGSDQ